MPAPKRVVVVVVAAPNQSVAFGLIGCALACCFAVLRSCSRTITQRPRLARLESWSSETIATCGMPGEEHVVVVVVAQQVVEDVP